MSETGKKIIKGLKAAVKSAQCDHEWEVHSTTGASDVKVCKKCHCISSTVWVSS
jgi:ribosomal protein L31